VTVATGTAELAVSAWNAAKKAGQEKKKEQDLLAEQTQTEKKNMVPISPPTFSEIKATFNLGSIEDAISKAPLMKSEKPKNPEPLPPPKTGQEIALDIACEAAKLAGKGAVTVATGTAELAASAWNAATKAAQEKKKEQDLLPEQTQTEDKGKLPISPPALSDIKAQEDAISKASKTKAEKPRQIIDPVHKEGDTGGIHVTEADVAVGKEESEATAAAVTLKDINEALRKAKEAAAKARKDASGLEMILMQRRYNDKKERKDID